MSLRLFLFVALASAPQVSAQVCDSWHVHLGDTIDLAPPRGFVEVCSLDPQLCRVLTAGYPPSVTTLGYFVARDDWERFRRDSSVGLNHYLIAQVALNKSAAQLSALKAFFRAQQGDIPDHSDLPRMLVAQGRVPLGILAETPTSISSGVVMSAGPAATPSAESIVLVASNSAAAVTTHLLSLYVFLRYRDRADIDTVKAVTQRWLQCIVDANPSTARPALRPSGYALPAPDKTKTAFVYVLDRSTAFETSQTFVQVAPDEASFRPTARAWSCVQGELAWVSWRSSSELDAVCTTSEGPRPSHRGPRSTETIRTDGVTINVKYYRITVWTPGPDRGRLDSLLIERDSIVLKGELFRGSERFHITAHRRDVSVVLDDSLFVTVAQLDTSGTVASGVPYIWHHITQLVLAPGVDTTRLRQLPTRRIIKP